MKNSGSYIDTVIGNGADPDSKALTIPRARELELRAKMSDHNKRVGSDRYVTFQRLLAVYRRGAHEYASMPITASAGHHDWAMARVDAFLSLLRRGRPANSLYTVDNDLLPSTHPCAESSRGLTAAAVTNNELTVTIKNEHAYSSPEEAVLALSEYSGLGYDGVVAVRAAWMRAVDAGESPFVRAKEFATQLHDSRDADLLPFTKKKMDVS